MPTERQAGVAAWDWQHWRDRLLADPRFQRWAVRFPLTRWIARRRARALFDLCAGFVYAQVLQACVEAGLFDVLAGGPLPLADIGRRLAFPTAAAERLLEAARALQLVEKRRGNRYGLGTLGAALRGNPGVVAMVRHHALLYADLAEPLALLRGMPASRRLQSYWAYAGARDVTPDDADVGAYSALMSASQAMIAAEVLDAYPIGRHAGLLDVAGGDGTFLAIAAMRAPALRLMLFDLPPVAARARQRFERESLAGRATAYGGDIRADALPRGADLATLIRVIHDHEDDDALAILRAVRAALPDGGTLLLAEPMAETPGAEPVAAYFTFYLLAMGQGRPRSAAQLTAMLHKAGFTHVREARTFTPMVTRVLVARR